MKDILKTSSAEEENILGNVALSPPAEEEDILANVALPYVVQHTLRLPYIGKVPVQGRTTKDGVWLGPRVASGSERVASVLKNFRNYVANKDHQGWRLARSLDITLGHPIPPFLYPSLG